MPKYRTRISLAFLFALVLSLCARETAAAADLRQASSADLFDTVQHGDAVRADEALAEFRRRAATGDPLAASNLDDLLQRRAAGGSDADMSELLARARAGDKRARSQLPDVAQSAALKGSATALYELRHAADRANRVRFSIDMTPAAETTFDEVLADRAGAGDAAALAELRQRVATGSLPDRMIKRPFLIEALGQLAGLGNEAIMDELQKAAADGGRDAQDAVARIFYSGTTTINRDLTKAAKFQGCPAPDETIIDECRPVDMQALPAAIHQILAALQCEDENPAPVVLNLDQSGTPQYKLNCHEPPHGPADAVLVGMVHGRWQAILWQSPLPGYVDGCEGFFPLKTSHAGLHDICLSDLCVSATNPRCRRVVLTFGGRQYDEQR